MSFVRGGYPVFLIFVKCGYNTFFNTENWYVKNKTAKSEHAIALHFFH